MVFVQSCQPGAYHHSLIWIVNPLGADGKDVAVEHLGFAGVTEKIDLVDSL